MGVHEIADGDAEWLLLDGAVYLDLQPILWDDELEQFDKCGDELNI